MNTYELALLNRFRQHGLASLRPEERHELREALTRDRRAAEQRPTPREEALGRRQRRGEALIFRNGRPTDERW